MITTLQRAGHKASTQYIEWSPWIAGFLLLFNFGFFGALLFLDFRAFMSDPITSQWAAAIATAAAAIVALAVASNEERRNHRRSVLAGELAAGSMRNYVGSLRVLAKQIDAKIPEAVSATDPNEPRKALAAHVKAEVTFLRESLEKIPVATIQPYNPRITAYVLHMIDQLHIAEVAAPFPGGDEGVRIALSTVDASCLVVEQLVAPARENAIGRYLSG